MDNIQAIIKEASTAEEQSVLATIIRIDGSSYRKEGAMMLFNESGKQMGMISGGCLEENLEQQAIALMKNTEIRTQTTHYNMSSEDDSGWGRGAGCNGIVHILLEKVDTDLQKHLLEIQTHLDAGLIVSLIKEIIPIGSSSAKMHLKYDATNVIVHTKIIPTNNEMTDMPFLKNTLSGNTAHGETHQTFFTQLIQPVPRLFIFGAGVDVRPLATFSKQTGFSVTIWDWRESLLNHSHFPGAELIHTTPIKEAILRTGITTGDYVVIMTHDFQKDKEIMDHILQIDGLHYLGILGPRRRTKRLLQNQPTLKTGRFSRAIPDYIQSPVGLPIGADGPYEIAISILADLILAKQGKSDEKRASIGQMQTGWNLFGSRKQQSFWK